MVAYVRKRSPAKSLASKLRSMSGEAKVNLAVKMTSTMYRVTMDSVWDRHPGISKTRLFQLTRSPKEAADSDGRSDTLLRGSWEAKTRHSRAHPLTGLIPLFH